MGHLGLKISVQSSGGNQGRTFALFSPQNKMPTTGAETISLYKLDHDERANVGGMSRYFGPGSSFIFFQG